MITRNINGCNVMAQDNTCDAALEFLTKSSLKSASVGKLKSASIEEEKEEPSWIILMQDLI
jgi:hypothetical protein